MNSEKDVLGEAINDYHRGDLSEIKVYINSNQDDSMYADVFFRQKNDFNSIEFLALEKAHGKILDIGAGAGCHSLVLQETSITHALEISDLSCEVMIQRGVKNILHQNIFDLKNEKYDTILLLMNGLGIVGTIEKTKQLFIHLKSLLSPNGIIMGDSSDIRYMFENPNDIKTYEENNLYYGEVSYELEYKNYKSKPFPWLFIDPNKMMEIALETGFEMEVLLSNDQYQYLAKFYTRTDSE